jgi:trimeric autotransporter adhesin
MSKLKLLSIIIATLFATNVHAQLKIGDNPNTIFASSALEIESTDKGVLIPRMTKAQKNTIVTPSTGLLVFQNAPDSVGFHYYNGTQWIWLQNSAEGWSTNGNNNITASNFLGTINNQALKFKVFNQEAGIVDSTTADVALGFGALKTAHSGPGFYANNALGFGAGQGLNSGYGNIAIGRHALASTGASIQNIAIGDSAMGNAIRSQATIGIGYQALKNYNGLNVNTYNIAIGYLSQSAPTASALPYSYFNTSIGGYAMAENVSGNSNTAVGVSALRFNTASNNNVAIGYNAGAYQLGNGVNGNNTFVGHSAGQGTATLSTGTENTGIGAFSLFRNRTGSDNAALGYYSLLNNTTGSQNIAFGNYALTSNTIGIDNTAIGIGALTSNNTGNSNIAIGNEALESNILSDNNIAIGKLALNKHVTNNLNVAIGNRAMESDTSGFFNVAIGSEALLTETSSESNMAIGFRALKLLQNGNANTAIGVGAMEYKDSAQECTAIGRFALGGAPGVSIKKDTGSVAIGTWAGRYNNASYNTFLGYFAGKGLNSATPISGNDNVAIGTYSLQNLVNGSQNVALGRFAGGATRSGSSNVFIGYNAGNKATISNSNRLYIENSDADSTNALIYGDFAADSLRLNAKVNIRDFTRLGTQASGAPSVKMKKLTGVNGAASATTSFSHGLTQSKILSVSVFITSSVTGNDLAPRSTYPGFEYDYYVGASAIVIRNIASNDGSITGGQVRILITYEE